MFFFSIVKRGSLMTSFAGWS